MLIPHKLRVAAGAAEAEGGPSVTPLLDVTGLGSAAGAYSFRKLRDAYAGSAIRIFDAGGTNGDLDVGFDGNGDIDTAAIASHCGTNNGILTRMYDQSGNGRDIKNAGSDSNFTQFKVYDGATESMLTDANGNPYVEAIANGFLQADAFSLLSQPTSVLGIMQLDADVVGVLLDGDDSTNRNLIAENVGNWVIHAGSTLTGNTSDSDRHLHGGLFNGASSEIREDGASVATGDAGSAGIDNFRVFKRFTSGPDPTGNRLQELVIWNSDLGADFATAEDNMNAYWSVY